MRSVCWGACMRICWGACMRICWVHACVYAGVHACTYAGVHACAYAGGHACTYAGGHACAYAGVHACTYAYGICPPHSVAEEYSLTCSPRGHLSCSAALRQLWLHGHRADSCRPLLCAAPPDTRQGGSVGGRVGQIVVSCTSGPAHVGLPHLVPTWQADAGKPLAQRYWVKVGYRV